MTLTEMVKEYQGKPKSSQEATANEWELTKLKTIFKDWLRTVGLPLVTGFRKHGETYDATESIRKLLITLVDEP